MILCVIAATLATQAACQRSQESSTGPLRVDGQERIEFTSVPAWGSTANLRGRVWGVNPASFKVAVYIFVETAGGWWTKPTFASPLTSIANDSTWTTAIVTGGNDRYATRIVAFLVPNGFAAPLCGPCATLPSTLFDNPYAITPRLPGTQTINFSGYQWVIKKSDSSIGKVGPGGNYFSDDPQDVWVDAEGLHLTITKDGSSWFCTDAILVTPLGYGTYAIEIEGPIDALDRNVVLGFFTWDDVAPWEQANRNVNFREIDIEHSVWGDAGSSLNAQFVVQPYQTEGNRHRFHFDVPQDGMSRHAFVWQQQAIVFQSVSGDTAENWVYTGGDIPSSGRENVRLNLWLIGGQAPSNGESTEVVIRRFEFFPPATGIGGDSGKGR